MNRTLVIGDIHGGLKAFTQVIERAGVTDTDTLIFLGDYVDGWSESAGVIDRLMSLSKQQPCVFIKGNHDEWCEEWLRTGYANDTWLLHGGQETIESYTHYSPVSKQEHLQFFEEMDYYSIDNHNRLFIHAGFTADKGPAFEPQPSNLSKDRSFWETVLASANGCKRDNDAADYGRHTLFKEIYLGHTPTLYYGSDVPMQAFNTWNIDTGAAFTGKLTILDIETKAFWQSDILPALYPGEKGRNRKR